MVADDRGEEMPSRPARIVSLVPSITETLFALGAGDRVVGVTRFCTHPPEAVARLPKVGGTKTTDCRSILRLAPDLVFMSEEENRVADYEELRAAGCAVFVSYPRSVDAVADWLERVGLVVGAGTEASRLAAEIRDVAATLRRGRASRRGLPVFCPVWRSPWISFNADTYCHDVLWHAGADNICGREGDRYCRVELAHVAGARPRAVLLPDEPYPFSIRDLPHLDGLWGTGAALPVEFIDGRALSWYGSRTAAALGALSSAVRALTPHGDL